MFPVFGGTTGELKLVYMGKKDTYKSIWNLRPEKKNETLLKILYQFDNGSCIKRLLKDIFCTLRDNCPHKGVFDGFEQI